MSDLLTKLRTDTWVTATWDEYIKAIAAPECEKAKGYYYNDKMRIEMPPVGDAHSLDHSIVMFAVNLFATLKGIDINGRDNCAYRSYFWVNDFTYLPNGNRPSALATPSP
jgi:Uma2 family endonuclease